MLVDISRQLEEKMIRKSIIGLIVIVAAIGLVFAAYENDKGSNPEKNTVNTPKSDLNAKNSASSNDGIISVEKAQKNAQKYIEEPGAKAGKPKLNKINGDSVYIVPVVLNGDTVGEIYIDAQTGKNLGGAGGVA